VGNLCNASPSSDASAPLLVLETKLKLVHLHGERTIPLQEFFVGPFQPLWIYKKSCRVQIPKPAPYTAALTNTFIKLPLLEKPWSERLCFSQWIQRFHLSRGKDRSFLCGLYPHQGDGCWKGIKGEQTGSKNHQGGISDRLGRNSASLQTLVSTGDEQGIGGTGNPSSDGENQMKKQLIELRVNGNLVSWLLSLKEHSWSVKRGFRPHGAKRLAAQENAAPCTVLIDGKPILSCLTLAIETQGKRLPPLKA